VGNAVLLSSDGKKAYVSRANMRWRDPVSGKNGSPISIVDVASHGIIKTLVLQVSTDNLALSPDGKYLFVTNGYQLSTIDTQTDELISNFSLRGFGASIVVRSDNLVIIGVADKRRFVVITLQRLLSRWPCSF
jgi:DNA-binding beta-propeller fold protein YncE